jgi:methyltransferase
VAAHLPVRRPYHRRVLPAAFAILIGAQRLWELRLARRNERWLRERGAVEHGRGHYPLFFLLHGAWMVGLLVESYARGGGPAAFWPVWFALWLVAQAGRWWVMRSLGPYWNTRILVVPGGARVTGGIYRYLNHPNYLVVAVEILAGPMIFGAWITAVVASLLNATLLLLVRLPAEEKALATANGIERTSSGPGADSRT